MQHFQKLDFSFDLIPEVISEIRDEHWDQNPLRTAYSESPHHQASDIILRFSDMTYQSANDELESVWYPAIHDMPLTKNVVLSLMRKVEGTRLGRVLITRLKPGCFIPKHIDGGETASYYERYHIPFKSAPGSTFWCGGETVHMKVGEVWRFDNTILHEIRNDSQEDRIHLIVDIRLH